MRETNNTAYSDDCVCETPEVEQWANLIFEQLLIPVVGSLGVIGNMTAIFVLRRPEMKSTFHHSLVTLAVLDIVFIMLIFFIVTTSFVKEAGIEVKKPKAAQAQTKKNANVFIAIRENGEIWMYWFKIKVGDDIEEEAHQPLVVPSRGCARDRGKPLLSVNLFEKQKTENNENSEKKIPKKKTMKMLCVK